MSRVDKKWILSTANVKIREQNLLSGLKSIGVLLRSCQMLYVNNKLYCQQQHIWVCTVM